MTITLEAWTVPRTSVSFCYLCHHAAVPNLPGSSVNFPNFLVQPHKKLGVTSFSHPTIRHVGWFRSVQAHIRCLLYVHSSLSCVFLVRFAAVMSLDRLPNGLQSGCQANGLIETAGTKWLVQKFGGTSIGKFPLDIVENVVRRVSSSICAAKVLPLTYVDLVYHMAGLRSSALHEVATPSPRVLRTGGKTSFVLHSASSDMLVL